MTLQLCGLDVEIHDGGTFLLLDGRRRVGLVDFDAEVYSGWVYLFTRATGNTVATFVGRADSLAGAVDLVDAARPERLAWA